VAFDELLPAIAKARADIVSAACDADAGQHRLHGGSAFGIEELE